MHKNAAQRVLVVEDEQTISDAVLYALRREGYECRAVVDGSKAVETIRSFEPHVVVLDVMLPGTDGFTILRSFPLERPFGVILVTARGDITDKVLGLELGADDYLTKPFDMRELLARVRSLFRRISAPTLRSEEPTIVWGNVVVDGSNREVTIDGKPLTLTPKEFDLAAMLLAHPGRVYTRDQLLESVWGYDYVGATRTVDIHIQRLRKKFGAARRHEADTPAEVFRTIHGVGYKALRAHE
jgi:two-component system alkaline phosphatase synthesis response regulator PhoP